MLHRASDTDQVAQVVIIESFNEEEKLITVASFGGGRINIPILLINGVRRIPKVGEAWMARRIDSSNWELLGRYSEISYAGLTGGDVLLDVDNYLYLTGRRVLINDEPIGVAECEEFDIPENGSASLTLGHIPIKKSIQVFNNGLLIKPSSIIVDKAVLHFTANLSHEVAVAYYQKEYSI